MEKKKGCGEGLIGTAGPSRVTHRTLIQTQRKSNINDMLPNEILAIILGKLDLKSRLMAERVCTQWRQHITALFDTKQSVVIAENQHFCRQFYYSLDTPIPNKDTVLLYDYMRPTAPQRLIRPAFTQIVAKYCRINYLMAISCKTSANFVQLLAQKPVNSLTSLHIKSFHASSLRITRSEAQLVAQNYPNLTHLCITASSDILISESAIELLLKGLKSLEFFHLDAPTVHPFTGQVFEHINSGIKSVKTSSNLFNATAISRLADKRVDQLRELIITRFDPNCMPLIADHFTRLTILSVDLLEGVMDTDTEFSLEPLFSSISRLTQLEDLTISVSENSLPIDEHIIYGLRLCLNLYSLTLVSTKLTNNCMESVVEDLQSLRQLSLDNVTFEGQDLTINLAPLRNVGHTIGVWILDQSMTDNVFEWLITNCPQINRIDVSSNDEITTDSMMACIDVCQPPHRSLEAVFHSDLKIHFNALNPIIPQNLIISYGKDLH